MVPRDFSDKVNRVLLLILFLFIGLGFRCFQLAVFQHDQYLESSKRPKRKTTIEQAERGLICDRNGQFLAINVMSYQAQISYDDIRKLPRTKYILKDGIFKKIPFRSEYIKNLSIFLAKHLQVDPLDLEDFIHGKASLFPNQHFTVKEDLSEPLYRFLRSQEKDWPGLKLSIKPRRFYPNGKLGSHIIGYMGMIHQREYDRIKTELLNLSEAIDALERGVPKPLPMGFENFAELKERYYQLKDKAYQISSLIGKAGIEGRFDESLRGIFGKKKIEVDIMGREKRVLPDSINPKPGDTLCLSIDKDLQLAAETLLTLNEEKRDNRFRVAGKSHQLVQGPWIKGGAIVAMDPKSGQLLALASYPRFDPNDFLKIDQANFDNVTKWLELPSYFSKLWEGELPLEKELFDPVTKQFFQHTKKLTFDFFLDTILSNQSKVKKQLLSIQTIQQAISILKVVEEIHSMLNQCPPALWIDFLYSDAQTTLLHFKGIDSLSRNYFLDLFLENQPKIELLKEKLSCLSSISHNGDKLLFIDLLRLFIPAEFTHIEIPAQLSKLSIADWFDLNQQLLQLENNLKKSMKVWFHQLSFRTWREENFKEFLKEKRKIERLEKKSQKPYLDYLEEQEKIQFKIFYTQNRVPFLEAILNIGKAQNAPQYQNKLIEFNKMYVKSQPHPKLSIFIETISSIQEELRPILLKSPKKLKELSEPLYGIYRLKGPKGALRLKDLAHHFYPTTGYGYSRSYAYQEAAPQGSIFKIITAYEGLKQHFLKNQSASNFDISPITITDNSDGKITDESGQVLGFFQDGKKINRFYKGGKLPRSSKRCGKISIKDALEMSSNLYFSILAADGLKSPIDLTKAAKLLGYGTKTGLDLPGEISGIVPYDVLSNRTGLYALSIGQHSLVVSPLQTAKMFSAIVNGGYLLKPEILHSKIKMIPKDQKDSDTYSLYHQAIGLKSQLFEETKKKTYLESKEIQGKTILKKLFFPYEIQTVLYDGLKRVMSGERGTARPQTILFNSKEQKERYLEASSKMVGKTASAEIVYHPFLDHDLNPILCKHIWFASAAYTQSQNQKKLIDKEPEIVIIVYLRYGDYGKEAAVLASELYHEYLKLKKR